MNYSVEMTEEFVTWIGKLRDQKARDAIAVRITRVRAGNFGQTRGLGGKLAELKIDVGKGYRVYYTLRGESLVLLMCGGDKGSQRRDIEKAKHMLKRLNEEGRQ